MARFTDLYHELKALSAANHTESAGAVGCSRRQFLAGTSTAALAACSGACSLLDNPAPVRVGVLFSATGTMSVNEAPLIDVARFAIDEINSAGGINGRPLESVVIDGRSEAKYYQRAAKQMIEDHAASVIIGCWTSAHRKAIAPIIDRANHLFIYPNQYEGVEEYENIICTGGLPNQQILPAVRWACGAVGQRVYLIGSDYIYPRIVQLMIREQLQSLGIEIVGESFLALGTNECSEVVAEIEQSGADLILNNLNGDINIAFFRTLAHSVSAARVLSFSFNSNSSKALPLEYIEGHFFASTYFDELKTQSNLSFIDRYHHFIDDNSSLGAAGMSVYAGLSLWAQAARDVNSIKPDTVRHAIKMITVPGPIGSISLGNSGRHLWHRLFIGEMQASGKLKIVEQIEHPMRAQVFPPTRSKEEWLQLVQTLYDSWGGRWAAPQQNSELS